MPEPTEWDRMLAGEMYLSADPALVAARKRARRLVGRYNSLNEEDPVGRRQILGELLGKLGTRVEIEPPFRCDYGSLIEVGDGFYANFGCVILDCNRVVIGRDVKFGPGVQVYAATHPVDPESRNTTGRELAFPITIGDGAWVGGGSIILPGVTIGEGTTIGAGSVVNRSIPARVVAAGVPCRVLRAIP